MSPDLIPVPGSNTELKLLGALMLLHNVNNFSHYGKTLDVIHERFSPVIVAKTTRAGDLFTVHLMHRHYQGANIGQPPT